MIYDAIVCGLGGMGSAAAYHLALRGRSVLGIEQFTPAHARGSSHGQTRLIRQAYFEHPQYVPLVTRAYELWSRLNEETSRDVLTITGGLFIGSPDCELIAGGLRSAKEHALPYEMLTAREIRRRFPQFDPSDDLVGYYEARTGFVRPEEAVTAHLERARELGAALRFEETVLRWGNVSPQKGVDGLIQVETTQGTYRGRRLIVTPGAWAPTLAADLGLPLRVERRVMYWFRPQSRQEDFVPDHFPCFAWRVEDDSGERPGAEEFLYGFPALADPPAVPKVALMNKGEACTAESVDRRVHDEEIQFIKECLSTRLPALAGELVDARTCLYTLTPDRHFVIGHHPSLSQAILAMGFSGHGFKFSSVIGEILADLAIDGRTRHQIGMFDPLRFGPATGLQAN